MKTFLVGFLRTIGIANAIFCFWMLSDLYKYFPDNIMILASAIGGIMLAGIERSHLTMRAHDGGIDTAKSDNSIHDNP